MKHYKFKFFCFTSLIVLSYFISGCNRTKNKIQIEENTIEYKVPESDVIMVLPVGFVKINMDDLISQTENSDVMKKLTERQIVAMNRLKTLPSSIDFLADTLNSGGIICVMRQGPHIHLNKKNAELATQQIISLLKNTTMKPIEKKLVSSGLFNYLKVKQKQKELEYELYSTFYLISTNTNTFAINVLNGFEEDYEDFVKKTKVIIR